ncbi:TIGR02117 family protein [Flavobacterium sp. AJR]|uniref:TIGR02117 family protein n=1 Tax=unclassified Flavobacterium TaxID=196869 RepID=UPI00057ED3E2|nr:TIGR02117 family protein [Flavobacterium sp. AJR]KIC02995.1 urease-associated protein [Flavobacterium sp. JRM]OUL61143.1 urease-associated protein [Flavobacterium sp. AJR]
MKKVLKIIGKILLAFVAFILLYIVLAYSISKITVEREPNTKEEVTIYIMTNGVHTDIVVPTRNEFMDWSKEVKYENTISKDTTYQYLAMGWGDKGFYLETPNWSDLRASTALKAASGLSNTAIHATYFSNIKENESCKKIIISKEQYVRLADYIKNSFKKDEKGQFIHIKTDQNYGKRDAFYEATGSYSLLHTCNTWANNALKVSGQKCCFWTPIDSAIFAKYSNK